MIALLDVNVLVALAWPNHVHHRLALDWFLAERKLGWATCPTTQSGFIRVSSNRAVIPEAKTPDEARSVLERIVALPGHNFWNDDVDLARTTRIDWTRIRGHRQVTDAQLLALAIERKGRLATLDAGIEDLVPRGARRGSVVVIGAR